MRKDAEKPTGRGTRHLLTIVTAYLKKRGLSGRRAATEVGLPEEAFRSLIKGHRPTVDRADELCRALGITMTIGTDEHANDSERVEPTPTGKSGRRAGRTAQGSSKTRKQLRARQCEEKEGRIG